MATEKHLNIKRDRENYFFELYHFIVIKIYLKFQNVGSPIKTNNKLKDKKIKGKEKKKSLLLLEHYGNSN